MKRWLFLSVFLLTACDATNSTEVGVRTCLFGVFEKRGTQQIYEPGGVYVVAPLVNAWTTLSIAQQNLLMNDSVDEGDRPVPDDVNFKTKDGNNVHVDVNVMWRVDPKMAGQVISTSGQSIDEIKERLVRPISRATIRDTFNEITSEEYYQVTVKNKMSALTKDRLAAAMAPYGIVIDTLQVQGHRFDPGYQNAINAQKQAEADVQTLIEQQKAMIEQKQSELEGKRAEWNQKLEGARGEAGSIRNDADGYYQTQSNAAKAIIAGAQAESDATKKEAEALSKLGGDAYVKMQLAKQLATKHIIIVPSSNVSTMNVNEMVNYLMGKAQAESK